jgi:hypothetical protein
MQNSAVLILGCGCTIHIQDHYFDVITNVVGLVAAVLGDKFFWWIDPAGAVLLAVYTITNWSGTVIEHAGYFPNLLKVSSMLLFFSSQVDLSHLTLKCLIRECKLANYDVCDGLSAHCNRCLKL